MTVQQKFNTLLDTSTATAADQWDDLLSLQVQLFLPQELDFLRGHPAWRAAESVLDVGCGNGYYRSQVRSFFPEKSYLGIDVSHELVDVAQRRHSGDGLRFERDDFFTGTQNRPFDVILLRFVLQHLDDFPAILAAAARRLRPGGSLFIVEPSLAESETWPATPLFTGLLEAFERRQSEFGRLRTKIADIGGLIAGHPHWRLTRQTALSVPRLGPFAGSATLATFGRWIDLCERAGGFDYPFGEARSEIADWGRSTAAFSRIVLRVINLTLADRDGG